MRSSSFASIIFDAFSNGTDRLDFSNVDIDIRSRVGRLLGVGSCVNEETVQTVVDSLHTQWLDLKSSTRKMEHRYLVETASGTEVRVLDPRLAIPPDCILLLDTGLETGRDCDLCGAHEPICLRMKLRDKPMTHRGFGSFRQQQRAYMRKEVLQFVLSDINGNSFSGFYDLPFQVVNLTDFPTALRNCLCARFNMRQVNATIVNCWWKMGSPKRLPIDLDVSLVAKDGAKVTLRLEESFSGDPDENDCWAKPSCVVKLLKNGIEFETTDFMPEFYKTVTKSAFKSAWKKLIDLAQDGEPWDLEANEDEKEACASLESYLKITFNKLRLQQDEGLYGSLLPRDGGRCLIFCTGLVTKSVGGERGSFIYGYCSKHRDGRYTRLEWITRDDPRAEAKGEERVFVNHNLPWPALWTANPAELVYQYHLGSPQNSDGKKGYDGFAFAHMINKHADRFPSRYLTTVDNGLGQPTVRNRAQLVADIYAAWKSAKKRLCVNYKWAGPSFYSAALDLSEDEDRKYSPVCLLVPLYLKPDAPEPEVVLVLRRQLKDGDPNKPYYFAPTCLTLEMARNNARVITRLDDTWLSRHK